MGNWARCAIWFGAGAVVGAAAVLFASKNSEEAKRALTNAVSKGMDLKDKASTLIETAKESLDDIAAEAKHAKEQRKAADNA